MSKVISTQGKKGFMTPKYAENHKRGITVTKIKIVPLFVWISLKLLLKETFAAALEKVCKLSVSFLSLFLVLKNWIFSAKNGYSMQYI